MKHFLWLLVFPIFFACDDSGTNNNNPFIPNVSFSVLIDTNLPLYNQLQFPGNAVYVPTGGVNGIFVCYTGSTYTAFEATCPNQALSSCSRMVRNGITAVCPCDEVEYNLINGLALNQAYPLKPYRMQITGSVIRVYN